MVCGGLDNHNETALVLFFVEIEGEDGSVEFEEVLELLQHVFQVVGVVEFLGEVRVEVEDLGRRLAGRVGVHGGPGGPLEIEGALQNQVDFLQQF